MRLHRLELEGFGPFRERQVVDFDAFADDGIFLIAGRTGAGKSSVLDGVCFALYGGVPRYDGVERRLRSDHCGPDDPTSVTVEFSAAGGRWRVTRSPEYERAKKRGSGTTLVGADAQLDEWNGAGWVGRASGARNVGLALEDVLGLSQQQFLQVILLAQNRFAEFLLAKNDERQRLLRRLFGTRTYEDYQSALEQRRKDAEQALASAGEGVSLLLGEAERILAAAELSAEGETPAADVESRFGSADLGAQRAAYRAETSIRERDAADLAHRDAEASHTAAKALRDAQERRARSRATLAELEVLLPKIAADRAVLDRAHAAEALRGSIEAAARAAARAATAASDVDAARTAWAAGGDDPGVDAADLERVVDELTGDLALWTAAALQERELAVAQRRLAEDEATASEFEQDLAGLDEGRAAIPSTIAKIDEELVQARVLADRLEGAKERLTTVTGRLASAREAERLQLLLRDAEAAYLAASGRHDDARTRVTDLLRRRLAGHAGELAQGLVAGEPCAVCGATEHPQPAAPSDEPVGDDVIAAAEQVRDAAATAESAAREQAHAARSECAAAVTSAGGESVDALEQVHAEAAAEVSTSRSAAERRDRLAAQRQDLQDADAAVVAERERLAGDLAALRLAIAAASAEVAATSRTIDAARADFPSVQDRIDRAAARRDRARVLAEALSADRAAERARRETAGDRDDRVAASDFSDAAEATAALRDTDTRERLDAGIREHEASLRAERDRLRELELELAGAPEEVIDLEPSSAALAAARDRWSRAVDQAAEASQTSARVADLIDRARTAHAALGDLAADSAVVTRLANTVAGRAPNTHRMTLESFVLAAELEEIVLAANLRLGAMTAGRYLLQHTDARAARGASSGLGLEVMDAHTGQTRPPHSLSGGETFLASLALALGLAEVVTARAGGVRLDTLFIDEGFGSLDADTLELAMRTLDELRQGGRTVGVISHVETMKEQLPAQLLVEASGRGPSVIRQDVASTV
ncbi:AAA family ATPase [Microbacterium sp. P5_E9]